MAKKPMRNEGDVKARIKEVLDATPTCWYYMPVQMGFGTHGIPDFICCIRGRFVAIEAKFGRNTLSTWQKMQKNAMVPAGATYLEINEKNVGSLPITFSLLESSW